MCALSNGSNQVQFRKTRNPLWVVVMSKVGKRVLYRRVIKRTQAVDMYNFLASKGYAKGGAA